MVSGSAVQTKGLGAALWSSMKRLMAAWRSTSERNTPRLSRRRVSRKKKVSTAFSHEHEAGVAGDAAETAYQRLRAGERTG